MHEEGGLRYVANRMAQPAVLTHLWSPSRAASSSCFHAWRKTLTAFVIVEYTPWCIR